MRERGLTAVGLNPLSTHGGWETCTVSFITSLQSHRRRLPPPVIIYWNVKASLYVAAAQRSKASRGLQSLTKAALLGNLGALCQRNMISHGQPGGLSCPPTLPFHPSSALPSFIPPSVPRGAREVGRIFTLPGATGSRCHPLTQTAGSALHTRIIRR